MNNLSSYRGLVDAKIRASDKDLPTNGLSLFYVKNRIVHIQYILEYIVLSTYIDIKQLKI